jgi:hypothetical protein
LLDVVKRTPQFALSYETEEPSRGRSKLKKLGRFGTDRWRQPNLFRGAALRHCRAPFIVVYFKTRATKSIKASSPEEATFSEIGNNPSNRVMLDTLERLLQARKGQFGSLCLALRKALKQKYESRGNVELAIRRLHLPFMATTNITAKNEITPPQLL